MKNVTARVGGRRRLDELAEPRERYLALLAKMPQGLIHYDSSGSVTDANPAACEILGRDLARGGRSPLFDGQAMREDGSLFPQEDLPVRMALRTGEIVSDVVAGVLHGRTGERRWLQVTAIPDAPDSRGRPRWASAIFADVTQRRRMEATLAESTGLLTRLREANVLGVVAATEDGTYEANDAFLNIIGYTRDDLVAGRISYQAITAPGWADRDRDAFAQLRHAGAFEPYDKEYIHQDGHRVPVLVGGAAVSQHPLRWVTFIVDLTAQQRAERERAELKSRELAARDQAEYARERLAFLLRAGSMVAATRDRHEMLQHAAELAVPALGDHCVVMLATANGALQATSVAHADPSRAPVLEEFRNHTIPAVGPMALQAAYSTGASQLVHEVEARLSQWHDLAPGLVDVLARLRASSVLATPLLADPHPAGVLVLARDAGRPAFAATDIEVAEEFARRLADGIAAAEAFAREHKIAETLQRSLLPGTLPAIAGLDLAASYLPASDGTHVGGDWYDAFPLKDGRIGLVIGDVSGHNITSAAVMGQVRSLLRAYALDNPDPGHVLQHTNDALTWLLPEALATAIYAVLDPATGELAYANAGHPPPLIIGPAGDTGYLRDAPGTMLGASPGMTQQTGVRRLAPGTFLLLYTDGLIEDRRRDISVGMLALAEALSRVTARTASELCAAAESALGDAGERTDDICLLAAGLPRTKHQRVIDLPAENSLRKLASRGAYHRSFCITCFSVTTAVISFAGVMSNA